jgi:hypothetical protein
VNITDPPRPAELEEAWAAIPQIQKRVANRRRLRRAASATTASVVVGTLLIVGITSRTNSDDRLRVTSPLTSLPTLDSSIPVTQSTVPGSSPSDQASSAGTCGAGQLSAVVGSGTGGAGGSELVEIDFRNESRESCVLEGYPVVRALNAQREDLRLSVDHNTSLFQDHEPTGPTLVRLDPGAVAYFGVYFRDSPPDDRPCADLRHFEVSAPGSSEALVVPFYGTPCSSPDQPPTLSVSAVGSGEMPHDPMPGPQK